MKVIILAAGKGSRLGDPNLPKPLTALSTGQSILGLQLDQIAKSISLDNVIVVVGYHKEMIMEVFPDLLYAYNPNFANENTSKSLLRALNKIDEDLLWLNGDVVFHPSIIPEVIDFNHTCMVVNVGQVGEEEVKYRTDKHDKILEVSKQVNHPQGEALGINLLKTKDLPFLKRGLENCKPQDYFEKGIEMGIQEGLDIKCFPIDSSYCTEVDFPEDLGRANSLLNQWA